MSPQDKILELVECAAGGEIDYQRHATAIVDFARRLDFNAPDEVPFSEWELVFIDFLFKKYCDGEEFLSWEDFLEEQDIYDDWQKHKESMVAFNEKYGLNSFNDE